MRHRGRDKQLGQCMKTMFRLSIWKAICMTEKKPFLKNRYYHLLDELYSNGIRIKSREGDARQYKAISWPTWRIYEYYVLLQVIVQGEPSH